MFLLLANISLTASHQAKTKTSKPVDFSGQPKKLTDKRMKQLRCLHMNKETGLCSCCSAPKGVICDDHPAAIRAKQFLNRCYETFPRKRFFLAFAFFLTITFLQVFYIHICNVTMTKCVDEYTATTVSAYKDESSFEQFRAEHPELTLIYSNGLRACLNATGQMTLKITLIGSIFVAIFAGALIAFPWITGFFNYQ